MEYLSRLMVLSEVQDWQIFRFQSTIEVQVDEIFFAHKTYLSLFSCAAPALKY